MLDTNLVLGQLDKASGFGPRLHDPCPVRPNASMHPLALSLGTDDYIDTWGTADFFIIVTRIVDGAVDGKHKNV